jgi:hypothetical protein
MEDHLQASLALAALEMAPGEREVIGGGLIHEDAQTRGGRRQRL